MKKGRKLKRKEVFTIMFTVIQQPNGRFCAVLLITAQKTGREALGRYTSYRAAEAAAHDFNKARRLNAAEDPA